MKTWIPENVRGIIKNRKRKNQIIDFSGLRIKNMTPTDIDGVIDLHGKGTIFLEFKYGDVPLSFGQKLNYERLVDDIRIRGKESIVFVCGHYVNNPEEDINAATTIVRSYYYNGKWTEEGTATLKEFVDSFVNYIFHEYSAD